METSPHNAIIDFVHKYARTGILLDTNILLLYVIGRYDPKRIEGFKRTNTFATKDYEFLTRFLSLFQRIVATPHVLTEVSNLAAHLNAPHKIACFESFADDLDVLDEHTEAARAIAKSPAFTRLGITDASLPLIARDRFLVLTDDLVLYAHLLEVGIDAINFNHIRLSGWGT